jgi:hypothetical protein
MVQGERFDPDEHFMPGYFRRRQRTDLDAVITVQFVVIERFHGIRLLDMRADR